MSEAHQSGDPTETAVSLFWTARAGQIAALADHGLAGGGARAGGHMTGIRDLVAQTFVDAGVPRNAIRYETYLPGYYRARKRWDLAVIYKSTLLAAVEFKSQVGSVGKNFNNRFEEALGMATDTLTAQARNSPFGDLPPWLGYVFVLKEDAETEKSHRTAEAAFPTDARFAGLSYNQRYQEMLRGFLGDSIYQAGWFITTKLDSSGRVSYHEPLRAATGSAFAAAVSGRVRYALDVLQ